LSTLLDHGGVHQAVGTRRLRPEWQRVERRFGALQTILATRSFSGIRRRHPTGGQFREGNCRDGNFQREFVDRELIQVNSDRCIQQPSSQPFRHGWNV
jgi:hypothetical protein